MKFFIIKTVKYLMIPVGFFYTLFRRKPNITILMYHRVNDHIHKEISVTYSNFCWQMEYLKKKKYKIITLDDAIKLSAQKKLIRKQKYIVLTFDDGYEDFYTAAYPVLLKYEFPCIVYLVPGFIETSQVFWWDKDIGKSQLMDWHQISHIVAGKLVEFGSHSMTHVDFNTLSDEELLTELKTSKQILEDKLNKKIEHFSYPRGIVTTHSLEYMKNYYSTAVSIFDGFELKNFSDEVKTKLKRIPVQRSDGRSLYGARIRGWLIPEEWIKKLSGRY